MTTPPAKKVIIAIAVASLLWFFMFSPWTGEIVNFWIAMSVSAITLTSLVFAFSTDYKFFNVDNPSKQLIIGVLIAFALWGAFWVGDKLSSMMFSFARQEVDAVYSMKKGLPVWLITILLLFVIGPAEELFWRGFVQRELSSLLGKSKETKAFIITTSIYAFVHIWSYNFMLIMAALVAGAIWGIIYRYRPHLLPALIVSHAIWDALVFVLLPI